MYIYIYYIFFIYIYISVEFSVEFSQLGGWRESPLTSQNLVIHPAPGTICSPTKG